MRKIKNRIRAITIITSMLFILSVVTANSEGWLNILSAVHGATGDYTLDIANTDRSFSTQNTYSNFADGYAAFNAATDINSVLRDSDGKVVAMKQGMAVLHQGGSDNANTLFYFTSKFPSGYTPYITNTYVAYYNYTSSDQSVTITISGYTGTCNLSDVVLIPSALVYPIATDDSDRFEFDYYTKDSSGDLIHYISKYEYSSSGGYYCTNFKAIITLDKAPSFMTEGIRYYSLDSINYYTDPYDAARGIKEVGSFAGTYCIYYKFLSYRTQTTYTAAQLNSYMAYKSPSSIYGSATDLFLKYQEIYGVNAAMELSFANLESAYGTSAYATLNNFFGIAVFDTDTSSGSTYASTEEGIQYHTKYLMNRYYLDAYAYIDWAKGTAYYDVADKPSGYINYYGGDFRYFGTCPGNKKIGVNVEYASDPFHGEKIAGLMYMLDKNLGFQDYNKYSIGITNKITYAYAQPNDTSWKLYKYASADPDRGSSILSTSPIGINVTVIGESGDYYIVRSDMPVNAEFRACYTWEYNFTRSIAYVKKSDITMLRNNLAVTPPPDEPSPPITLTSGTYTITTGTKAISKITPGTPISDFTSRFENGSVRIFVGETQLPTGTIATGMNAKIYDNTDTFVVSYQCVITGDINGDGAISITDLVQVNNNLLKKSTLSGAFQSASDINGDGKTTITDLVLINNHLLKKQTILPR